MMIDDHLAPYFVEKMIIGNIAILYSIVQKIDYIIKGFRD